MEPILGKDSEGIPYIQIDKYILRLDLEELDEHYKTRARNELRESEEIVEDAKTKLLAMILEEKNLLLPIEDESFLYKFLRPCKYYPESTFRLLKRYYTFLAKNPKYTTDLMPSTVETIFKENVIEFLPIRANDARVMIIDVGNWDPNTTPVALLFKAVIMSLEIAMIEPRTQVGGVHVILDLKGLTLKHILQFNPMLAKLLLDFVQECTAIRLKGIHVLNQPYIFNMGYAIFKPFIGQKLKQRLHFHGKNWVELMKHIPSEELPERFGGTLNIPPIPGHLLVEVLTYYESEYKKMCYYGYVDPAKHKHNEEILKKIDT